MHDLSLIRPTFGFFNAASIGNKQALPVRLLTLAGLTCLLLLLMLLDPRGLAARADELPPSGLFFLGEDAGQGYPAPLLNSDVVIDIEGPLARVTVRQAYRNPSEHWMEGVYVFPLPEGSAVDRLTLLVGERRIEGKILPKEEARRVYEQAAAEGRKASLLSAERANVFATAVANIAPGESISVEIGYQDRADFADGLYSYRFPMVVAPRYTPAGPGPALVSGGAGREGDLFGPVSRDDAPEGNRLSLIARLNAGLPLAEVESLYHPALIEADGEGRRIVTLADGQVPPNKDFVLAWRPLPAAQPATALFAEQRDGAGQGGDSFLLLDILPPALPIPERQELPRDMILVVDTSGSMSGPSMEQARAALLAALDRLQPGDRFNIIRFSSDVGSLYRRAQPATPENIAHARKAVGALEAGGGTDMRPALETALAERPARGRLRQIVFLTDGAVGNEAELFRLIAGRLGENRLFTVGIGPAPNGYFMRKAAEAGRGSFTWIGKVEEVEAQMTALLDRLSRPAMTDLTLSLPPALAEGAEQYPAVLADLYSGQPLRVALKLPGRELSQLSGPITLTGRYGQERWSVEVPLSGLQGGEGIAALWARDKVTEIMDSAFSSQEPKSREQIRDEATAVALAFDLVTPFTSLVAVDESEIARPEDESLLTGEIERPLPEGLDPNKVFGPGSSSADPQPAGAPAQAPRLDKAAFEALALEPVALPAAARSAAQQSLGLPQTASPALLQALAGLALLALGGLLLLLLARRHPAGVAEANPGKA